MLYRCVIVSLLGAVLVSAGASAVTETSVVQPSSSSSQPPTVDSGAPKPGGASAGATTLKGGVQKTVKNALIGLRSFGDGLHKLRRAASDLYGEATRQEADLVDEPEIVGGTIIYIPVNVNISQCLPPRKKWVDHHMAAMQQLLPLVEEESSSILFPDDKEAAVGPFMQEISALMQSSQASYQRLVAVTQNPPYDGQAIADNCQSLEKDLKQVDKLRKKVRKIVED